MALAELYMLLSASAKGVENEARGSVVTARVALCLVFPRVLMTTAFVLAPINALT